MPPTLQQLRAVIAATLIGATLDAVATESHTALGRDGRTVDIDAEPKPRTTVPVEAAAKPKITMPVDTIAPEREDPLRVKRRVRSGTPHGDAPAPMHTERNDALNPDGTSVEPVLATAQQDAEPTAQQDAQPPIAPRADTPQETPQAPVVTVSAPEAPTVTGAAPKDAEAPAEGAQERAASPITATSPETARLAGEDLSETGRENPETASARERAETSEDKRCTLAKVEERSAHPGTRLVATVARWATNSGWTVVSKTRYDWPIEAAHKSSETLGSALLELANAYRAVQPAPKITAYGRNCVIVVRDNATRSG